MTPLQELLAFVGQHVKVAYVPARAERAYRGHRTRIVSSSAYVLATTDGSDSDVVREKLRATFPALFDRGYGFVVHEGRMSRKRAQEVLAALKAADAALAAGGL